MPTTFDTVTNNALDAVAAGGYTAGSGTLNLADASEFPAAGPFPVVCYTGEGEAATILTVLRISARAGNALTVAGAEAGYADVNLAAGVKVGRHVMARDLSALHAAVNGVETVVGGVATAVAGQVVYRDASGALAGTPQLVAGATGPVRAGGPSEAQAAGYAVAVLQPDDGGLSGVRVIAQNGSQALELGWNGIRSTSACYVFGEQGVYLASAGQVRVFVDAAGNVDLAPGGALATTATDGFAYLPTCPGPPTGTPTAKAGRSPAVVDSTNNRLYLHVGGAWRYAALT